MTGAVRFSFFPSEILKRTHFGNISIARCSTSHRQPEQWRVMMWEAPSQLGVGFYLFVCFGSDNSSVLGESGSVDISSSLFN